MPKETYTLSSTYHTSLFIRRWTPDSDVKGVVCLVHGLGEHSGRYEHVAEAFVKEGYAFIAYDQRGHGKSDGKRGDTPSYNQLLDDLDLIINSVVKLYPTLPFFLYGHSMGGNIATGFLLEKDTKYITGALITSPWLTLSFEPPKWQVSMGKLILKVAPGLVQSNKLDTDNLSRDKTVGTAYQNDPLVHDKISPRLFFGIQKAGLEILNQAKTLKVPTLIVHGTQDAITSPQSSQRLAEDSGQQYKVWEKAFHETHNELNKEEVIDFNISWIKQQH